VKQQQFAIEGEYSHLHKDVVLTPRHIAVSMVNHFKPSGAILDPCRGEGVFSDMIGCDWCDIQEGSDFFDWETPMDWIIGNPPYSIYSDWIRHSFDIADNIVYLIPINKAFNSSSMLKATYDWGGIAEIVHVGPGAQLKFPIGFAIGAVHYKRCYKGGITYRHGF
jgi:hypothetical protein